MGGISPSDTTAVLSDLENVLSQAVTKQRVRCDSCFTQKGWEVGCKLRTEGTSGMEWIEDGRVLQKGWLQKV